MKNQVQITGYLMRNEINLLPTLLKIKDISMKNLQDLTLTYTKAYNVTSSNLSSVSFYSIFIYHLYEICRQNYHHTFNKNTLN